METDKQNPRNATAGISCAAPGVVGQIRNIDDPEVHRIFKEYQDKHGIEDGGIDPLDYHKLSEQLETKGMTRDEVSAWVRNYYMEREHNLSKLINVLETAMDVLDVYRTKMIGSLPDSISPYYREELQGHIKKRYNAAYDVLVEMHVAAVEHRNPFPTGEEIAAAGLRRLFD